MRGARARCRPKDLRLLCLWLATRATLDSWLVTGAFLVLGTGLWLLERRFGDKFAGFRSEPG